MNGTHLRVLTRGAGEQGAVQLARPLDEVDRQLDRVVLVLLLVGAAGVALGAALGALVARTALSPVASFTRRTEELAADGDTSQRIQTERTDELGRLARTFNTTLDALERSVEAQRHLVADASHELRTPIASLRANIQTLEHSERLPEAERASLRADILEELDELTSLVADIVELARGAKPGELVDDVRVDEIVEQVAARARARAPDGVTLDVATEPTLVRGEPERIQRAISNLVDNALKWSPQGGRVEIELADGGLSVRDHGPGFAEARPPARVRALLPRGQRPRAAGLGPRPRDRAPGGRGARRRGAGRQRRGRRRAAPGVVRPDGQGTGSSQCRRCSIVELIRRASSGSSRCSSLRAAPLRIIKVIGVVATTCALRGASSSTPISPKKSPGPSSSRYCSSRTTLAVPSSIT